LLVVGTYRPVELAMAQHPLRVLTQELRVAMSLAYLWQQQYKRDEARALLAPVYGWGRVLDLES